MASTIPVNPGGASGASTESSAARPHTIPYTYWGVLCALFVIEVVAVSFNFDSRSVRAVEGWQQWIRHAGWGVRACGEVAIGVLLVAGPTWLFELQSSPVFSRRPRTNAALLAGNLLAYTAFFACSARLLGRDGLSSAYAPVLAIAWASAGLATFGFWAFAILPGSVWLRLFKSCPGAAALGALMGAVAYGVAVCARDQWQTLAVYTLYTTRLFLRPLFSDIVCNPAICQLGTTEFQVEIAPVCSGYEGMALIVVLMACYLFLSRRELRFPRALVLLPIGMALMWISNALRIASLIAIGSWGYEEIAVGGFHSLAGWVFFLVIGVGMMATARRSSFFAIDVAPGPEVARTQVEPATAVGADAAYLVPAMAIIAVSMFTTAFFPGFDRWYAARVLVASAALLFYRKRYTELRFALSWEAAAIGVGVFAFWVALERFGHASNSGSTLRAAVANLTPLGRAAWIFFRVVGSVVTVPIAEELAFRGYLSRRLIAADFESVPPGKLTAVSLLVSSFLFGLLHGRWFAGTLAGLAYAFAYHKRGRLSDAVVAHGITNSLIAAAVLAGDYWSLWG